MSKKASLLLNSNDFFAEVVKQAFNKRKISTYPAVETYLVKLLEHYLDARNLFESEVDELGNKKPQTLAEMYLSASQKSPTEKAELLKKLADRSLYISGFFGDSLNRKAVDVDYYVSIGGSAYATLANSVKEDTLSAVYKVYSLRFLDFVEVLTYISHQTMTSSDANILRLYDHYMRTGSETAKEKLIELGVITLPQELVKLAKQD